VEVLPADFGPCSEKEMLNQSRKFTAQQKNRTQDSHHGERNGELFVAVGQRRSFDGWDLAISKRLLNIINSLLLALDSN
jgi:hypothetical protein